MRPGLLPPLARLAVLALAAAGCGGGERPREEPAPPREAPAASPAPAWRSNPAEGVGIRTEDGATVVETGPHVVLWPEEVRELAPPYTVRATLRKRAGRLHEGVGIVFGASSLPEPPEGQRYSYFLVRGDGSFLVKRRQGAQTPVVRDWTRHPAVERDGESGGPPNELEVRVGRDEVAFRVNGAEVARVPAAELDVRGVAGVRSSHDVHLVITDFQTVPGAGAAAPGVPP